MHHLTNCHPCPALMSAGLTRQQRPEHLELELAGGTTIYIDLSLSLLSQASPDSSASSTLSSKGSGLVCTIAALMDWLIFTVSLSRLHVHAMNLCEK